MVDTPGTAESATVAGLKFFRRLEPLLERLRPAHCKRDRAGNRRLFFDQLCGMILLTFFNPAIRTLRDLHRASRLATVRRKLGCSQASLGSLSEAMHLFDPELIVPILKDLLGKIPQSPAADPRLKALAQIPTAVDGSFLLQLPQITQACFAWRKDRGWKLHAHFEVLRGVPSFARVTDASGRGAASEKAVLKAALAADRCYIVDRGYEEFSLYNDIVAAGSSYVGRVRNDHHFQAETMRELSAEAVAAGVLQDAVGRMGSPKSKRIQHPDHLQRRIIVRVTHHPKRGGRKRQAASQDLVLATNLLDVPAETIVLLYRYRWLIELFFRWLKCVLSCRHLLSRGPRGIQIQIYCALIACLLIQLACPVKPNQWTYKLLCLYQQGWATEDEVLEHLRQLAETATPSP
ncbi:MAG: IS4 family transposase [Planctomycetota bacterium]